MIPELTRTCSSGAGYLIIFLFLLALSAGRFDPSSGLTRAGERNHQGICIQIRGEVSCPGTYFFDHPPCPEQIFPDLSGIRIPESDPQPFVSHARLEVIKNRRERHILRQEIPAHQKLTLGLPVSLNLETEEGLTAVPGLGPQTAKTLIMERRKRGGFKSLEELKSVKGIGNGIFQQIRPFLTL